MATIGQLDTSTIQFLMSAKAESAFRSSSNTGFMNLFQGEASTPKPIITGTLNSTYNGTYTFVDNGGQSGTARYQRGSDNAWILRDSTNNYWGIHTSGSPPPTYSTFQYYNTTGNFGGTFTGIGGNAGTNATCTAPITSSLVNCGTGYGFRATEKDYYADGTNDQCTTTSSLSMSTTSTFTFHKRFKLTTLGAYRIVYGKYVDANNYFWLGVTINNRAYLEVRVGGVSKTVDTTLTMSADTYYNVTYTKNGSNFYIYVDGVDKTTSAGTYTMGAYTFSNCYLWTYNGSSSMFKGNTECFVMYTDYKSTSFITSLIALGSDFGGLKGVDKNNGIMGLANTFAYAAGANGTLTGTASQTVEFSTSGSEVTAVPDSGYAFEKWSDDVMTASRTDTNSAGSDLSVTASFVAETPVTPSTTNRRKSKYFNGFPSWSQRKKNLR